MKQITKDEKVRHLKDYIRAIIGMTAHFNFEDEDHDQFLSEVDEYLTVRAILLDYAPECEAEFSEDFSVEIEKWIAETNTLAGILESLDQ